MSYKLNRLTIFLLILSIFIMADPAVWAGSKSATVKISCRIAPMLEISSQATKNALPEALVQRAADRTLLGLSTVGNSINVTTNLGNHYQMGRQVWLDKQGQIKLYSVTAI